MKRIGVLLLAFAVGSLAAFAVQKSPTIVYIDGAKYYIHTVQPGETLYALSKAYEVAEKVILEQNPKAVEGLRAGENLRIPVVGAAAAPLSERKLRRMFDTHYVSAGETLYAIARLYEIPIPTLIEDNPGLDPIHLSVGQRILVRRKKIGSEDEADNRAQWEAYRSSLASVAPEGAAYHIVRPGETFYSLSRRFGIGEDELSRMNGGLRPADLKAGAIIRVPAAEEAEGMIGGDSVAPYVADPFADRMVEEIVFRALGGSEPLRVALLLPIAVGEAEPNHNYLEFYQGFLLGLDSVKHRFGRSVEVGLFNTARDSARIREITLHDAFRRADLVVGPVYEEGIYPVVRFAEQERIPVVSPLAVLQRMNSDVLFQMAPDPAHKYDKVADLTGDDRTVTLIYTDSTDPEFEAEMLALLGDRPYTRHVYRYEHPNEAAKREEGVSPADLTPLLENDLDNVFIIMADNEVDVDRILAALASADTSLRSRSRAAPRYTVLGNARWNRYNNIDRTLFFKNKVVFLSTYHAKRDAQAVVDFDRAYLRAFGALPTLYAYRGYDTALIFCPAMYNDIEYDMEDRRYTPLQTTYRFGQAEGRHNHVNRNWTRVEYRPDFTIRIE